MRIISVTGYHGTGSSALIDYIKEFEDVNYIDSEVHVLVNNGGLDELNYKFNNNYSTYLLGISISRFLRLSKCLSRFGLYGEPLDSNKLWDGYFLKRTRKFIEEITDGYQEGYSQYNLVDKRIEYKKWDMKTLPKIKKNILKYLFFKRKTKIDDFKYGKDKIYFPKDNNVYKIAQKKYINDLFGYLYKKNKEENILFDHFFPVAAIENKNDYFENSKIIVVDRDPRDIYILNAEIWKDSFVPLNPLKFIEFYKNNRRKEIEENKDVKKIRFEDLIYKYEETTSEIKEFLNFKEKNHKMKNKYLDVKISINNTQLFNRYSNYKKEIDIIEKELKEYCYDFPKIDLNQNIEIF